MPQEKILPLPLDSNEIIAIILQRIEKRLRADCYLHEANTYNGFSFTFEGKIKFNDMSFGKDTLVWDVMTQGEAPEPDAATMAVLENYTSGDSPNRARVEHDLDLPVQTQEGKRTVIRKRKIRPEEAVA